MGAETVARRYATALADVVTKTGETETVRAELKSWEDLIDSNTDLQTAFRNPAIQQASKEKVLESLLERSRPSKTTSNFLRVLLRNNRLLEIGEINERFESELDERNGVASAEVTSARNLTDREKTELVASLQQLTGRQINPVFDVDSEIIGGVIARVGSTVYDSSVRTQLDNLRQELIES